MNPVSILMLGMAMSTDAFAAAVAKGTGMANPRLREALTIGLIFGIVEALTPVLGWWLGSLAAGMIERYDHWVAFLLLTGLGLHAIHKALQPAHAPAPDASVPDVPEKSRSYAAIALTGLATSIDAMAVGVGLAFVDVHIAAVATVIGLCTFVMVTLGILTGKAIGEAFGRRAEFLGGVVLIAIGAAILHGHLAN